MCADSPCCFLAETCGDDMTASCSGQEDWGRGGDGGGGLPAMSRAWSFWRGFKVDNGLPLQTPNAKSALWLPVDAVGSGHAVGTVANLPRGPSVSRCYPLSVAGYRISPAYYRTIGSGAINSSVPSVPNSSPHRNHASPSPYQERPGYVPPQIASSVPILMTNLLPSQPAKMSSPSSRSATPRASCTRLSAAATMRRRR